MDFVNYTIHPVILSSSRETDIPAFYTEWFAERLKEGWCEWKNNYNGVFIGCRLAARDGRWALQCLHPEDNRGKVGEGGCVWRLVWYSSARRVRFRRESRVRGRKEKSWKRISIGLCLARWRLAFVEVAGE